MVRTRKPERFSISHVRGYAAGIRTVSPIRKAFAARGSGTSRIFSPHRASGSIHVRFASTVSSPM